MRNVAIATVLLFLSTATGIGLSGCREESADMSLRRAKLVGNENIELKKQLKQRDKESKRQKQLVVQCRADRAKDQNLSSDTTSKMTRHLAESGKQVSALKAENTQLKLRDKEIKRQKQRVVPCCADQTKEQKLIGDNTLKLLKHLAESARQVTVLTAENTQLKEKIKELEAK